MQDLLIVVSMLVLAGLAEFAAHMLMHEQDADWLARYPVGVLAFGIPLTILHLTGEYNPIWLFWSFVVAAGIGTALGYGADAWRKNRNGR